MDALILVVDDNVINCLVAQRSLKKAGYLVDVVNDGSEAVQACTADCYDLVLMDCNMPEMDGHEATQQIRKLEKQQSSNQSSSLSQRFLSKMRRNNAWMIL